MDDMDNYYVVPSLAGPRPAPKSMSAAVQWQRRYARPTVATADGPYLMHPRDGLRGLGWAPGGDAAYQGWRWARVGLNVLSIYAGVQAMRGKKVHDAVTLVCLAGAVLDLVDAV